jgi:hypothetical protein
MDNPAVSAPAIPERRSSEQGTANIIKTEIPSSISEPSNIGTPIPSKNDEEWRRVVRNFSPSCESSVAQFYVVPQSWLPSRPSTILTLSRRVRNDNGYRRRRSHILRHPVGSSLAILDEHYLLRPQYAPLLARTRNVRTPLLHLA